MVFPEAASALGSTQVLSSMAGTVAYLVAMTLVAFAVAGILRATGGAITAVVALVFLIPLVLQVLSSVTDWTWVMWINEYLPTALGSTLGYGLGSEVPYTLAADAGVHVPNYWESLAALAMWVVWPMFISVKLFFSRDAK